jgi:hypothetical protein
VSLESKWDSVEDFVHSLKAALTEEMAAIRQTELDTVGGGFRSAVLSPGDGVAQQVFVDKLDRVILPVDEMVKEISTIRFEDNGGERSVVQLEPRYEGDKQVAWVVYLAK